MNRRLIDESNELQESINEIAEIKAGLSRIKELREANDEETKQHPRLSRLRTLLAEQKAYNDLILKRKKKSSGE